MTARARVGNRPSPPSDSEEERPWGCPGRTRARRGPRLEGGKGGSRTERSRWQSVVRMCVFY